MQASKQLAALRAWRPNTWGLRLTALLAGLWLGATAGQAQRATPPACSETGQHPSGKPPSMAGGARRAVDRGVSVCDEVLLPRGRPGAYDCQAGGVLRQRVCSVHLCGQRHRVHTHRSHASARRQSKFHSCHEFGCARYASNIEIAKPRQAGRRRVQVLNPVPAVYYCLGDARSESWGWPWHQPSGRMRP